MKKINKKERLIPSINDNKKFKPKYCHGMQVQMATLIMWRILFYIIVLN